jgi:hypothetical protein
VTPDSADDYHTRVDDSLEQIKKTLAAMHRDQEDINELKAETRALLRKLRVA